MYILSRYLHRYIFSYNDFEDVYSLTITSKAILSHDDRKNINYLSIIPDIYSLTITLEMYILLQ